MYKHSAYMASGKRKRIMISCVTFETVKITEPVKFYDINKIHLIHYVKDPESDSGMIYREFYDQVCNIIKKDSNDNTEIKEHIEKVSQFLPMFKLIMKIIETEFNTDEPIDIFVNISAGTSEYTAAAVIASMMNPEVIPFSVSTENYTIKNDKIRDLYYADGAPVGLTESIYEPVLVPKYNISMPDRNLVLGLKVLKELSDTKHSVKGPEIISKLKEKRLWRMYAEGTHNLDLSVVPEAEKSDSVYYYRDFVSKWLSNGWVEKNNFSKRYDLTEEGLRIVDTFYAD